MDGEAGTVGVVFQIRTGKACKKAEVWESQKKERKGSRGRISRRQEEG